MCIGAPRRVVEYDKALSVPGAIIWDDETFYPEHENSRRRVVAAGWTRNSLIIIFVSITVAFYAFFKMVVFSITELREAVFVFVISFAVGFLTATTRN
jgi:hypothetical protein